MTEFNRDRGNRDGLQRRCKVCHKKSVQKYQREHPRSRGKRISDWKQRWPEKTRAHNMVRNAVRRGSIIKPDECDRCHHKVDYLEAHHHDYDRPLEVEWLCQECHLAEHANEEVQDGVAR